MDPSSDPPAAPPEPPDPDPEPEPDSDPEPEPEPSPLPDSSRPPGCWLIAGPELDGPGVIEDVGCFPLDPSAPFFPPPPPDPTTHTTSSANRPTTDSRTALRRQ
ncbi:hypothetical protein SAV31267_045070 [Streptomyces avermitilis]|uniref:Uncharacterized protein n=1 Tax=Streptomyces avermitilis TaxID=33903 RepID=A0A4D4MS74_STRAX|nr:hypothetical protein SAV31267_045070 [Streptomyces avermitilis]